MTRTEWDANLNRHWDEIWQNYIAGPKRAPTEAERRTWYWQEIGEKLPRRKGIGSF